MNTFEATAKGPLRQPGYIDPDDVTLVKVFWGAPVFETSTVYREGDICRPSSDNGYYYECTTNGVSGGTEPVTWGQVTQASGTATFTAVPYDLWLLPTEYLVTGGSPSVDASTWTASDSVTLASASNNLYATTVNITDIPSGVSTFILTNQVRKDNGEILSRSFKYKVNNQ